MDVIAMIMPGETEPYLTGVPEVTLAAILEADHLESGSIYFFATLETKDV